MLAWFVVFHVRCTSAGRRYHGRFPGRRTRDGTSLRSRRAKVALVARGSTGLAGAARDVRECGGIPLVIAADVSDRSAMDAIADQVERELGPIDVWVNNAMVSEYAAVWDMTADEFEHVVEVTLLGQVYGTMAALRYMRPRDRGVIVHVGSALAHRSIPLQSAYCAAKHGVYGFVESLRTELIHTKSNVRVTMVSLPGVNTPQFEWTRNKTGHNVRPVGPIYQPEVAADAIVYATHADRKEVLVGWPTVESVVAEKLESSLLDQYIADKAWEGALEGPISANHADNFWSPVERDYGAHGRFDAEARSNSLQLWGNMHRGVLTVVAVAIAVSAFIAGYSTRVRQ